ncbi:TPA: hypothetical protein SIA32_002923 [Aeromonas sobria]|jgi:hypothetical protein|nr:hypothetical protein [Aeromonas sobria]
MTTDYTQADSELTLSFPEALSIPDFKLDEVISGMTPSQTHYLTLTICNEQPNSQLNQALQKAISGKNHVQITVTRSDGRTCNENVVVKESEPKQPNVYRLNVIGPSNHTQVLGLKY